MKKTEKNCTVLLLALILVSAMTSCAQKAGKQHIHKIGVVVYDLKDEQVQAFRQYMEGYIAAKFFRCGLPVFCRGNHRRERRWSS